MTADKEKRRAISREAARKRRRVESDVFGDLCRLLPLQSPIRDNLDKPSIIRLTLSYIRIHGLLKGNSVVKAEGGDGVKCGQLNGKDEPWECDGGQDEDEEEKETGEDTKISKETDLFLRTLEGFLMVLSTDGDMIFLSDNVGKYMGLTQTELMGHNIFEFTHPCEHEEIKGKLRISTEEVWCGGKRDFVMRVKSALTHRGRSTNLKSATWKVLHCQGRAKVSLNGFSAPCLLLTCQPLPLSHTLLSTNTFTSQHSMDMRFTYCDQRVMSLLGFTPEELLGRSIYNLCHTRDANCLAKNHMNLCLKTQSVSGQYRMLVRSGGYVWVETHSAVIPSVRPSKSRPGAHHPLCILCVTYVLSGVEEPSLQLSLDQTLLTYSS